MATTNISINPTYTLVTESTNFVAWNGDINPQQWVRSATLPAETLRGIEVPPGKGLPSDKGAGNLYVRGGGVVVVWE